MRAGQPGVERGKIPGGQHHDAAGLEMLRAQAQRRARVRQVLDDVEENDHVHRTEASQRILVGDSTHDVEAGATGERRRILGQFDACYVEVGPGFLEKEAVGATDVEQPAAIAMAANEIDHAGELAPQHRLGAEIVGIAVRVLSGEIAARVVGGRVEIRGIAAPEPATFAAKDIAPVLGIEEALWRRLAAGGAKRGTFAPLQHGGLSISQQTRSATSGSGAPTGCGQQVGAHAYFQGMSETWITSLAPSLPTDLIA